jgi:hypothetical protein
MDHYVGVKSELISFVADSLADPHAATPVAIAMRAIDVFMFAMLPGM